MPRAKPQPKPAPDVEENLDLDKELHEDYIRVQEELKRKDVKIERLMTELEELRDELGGRKKAPAVNTAAELAARIERWRKSVEENSGE
jgi:hypothetical protein